MNVTLPPSDAPAAESATDPGTDRATIESGSSCSSPREFVRPSDGRRIGGVCAAIADRNGWSRITVRLVALASILLPGPQVFAYLIAWVVMPSESERRAA